MDKLERRTVSIKELRVENKQDNENVIRTIEGHAAVFNQWSETLGSWFPFKERVLPGAFTETIQNDDIRALWNHNPDYVLGRKKSGTLGIEEDDTGLKVVITPPDTQWARDLTLSIERGDIDQMSFGFVVVSDRWGMEEGMDVRELLKVQLFDVSPVTFPAYPQTDVGVRSTMEAYDRYKEEQKRTAEEQNGWKMPLWKRKIGLLKRD